VAKLVKRILLQPLARTFRSQPLNADGSELGLAETDRGAVLAAFSGETARSHRPLFGPNSRRLTAPERRGDTAAEPVSKA
jgi:hypothetical protein